MVHHRSDWWTEGAPHCVVTLTSKGPNAKVQLFLMDNMFSKTPRHCMCEQGSMTGHSNPKGHFYPSKACANQLQIPVSNLDGVHLKCLSISIRRKDSESRFAVPKSIVCGGFHLTGFWAHCSNCSHSVVATSTGWQLSSCHRIGCVSFRPNTHVKWFSWGTEVNSTDKSRRIMMDHCQSEASGDFLGEGIRHRC